MTPDKEMIYILKDIVKELHELNRKLDRFGQASIFSKSVKEDKADTDE